MAQVGRSLGLLPKAVQKVGVLGEALSQHLDGHNPVEKGIVGLVDDGHPPTGDGGQQAITVVEQLFVHPRQPSDNRVPIVTRIVPQIPGGDKRRWTYGELPDSVVQ